MLKHCREILIPVLLRIYRAADEEEHYPAKWKEMTMILLRKEGKPDYGLTKAYRLVALLPVIVKIHQSVRAEEIVHMAETYNLLPVNTFGGRVSRLCSDSLMTNMSWVYDKWRKGLAVSGLFLDISGVFPKMVISVLIHDLRKHGIPEEITKAITRMNKSQTTQLKFNGFTSEPIPVLSGMDQEILLSMILYAFYAADLLEPEVEPVAVVDDELDSAFIDDTGLLVAGKDFEETNGKLIANMDRQGGAKEWVEKHNVSFEPDKFALIHFTRKHERTPNRPNKTRLIPGPALQLGDIVIQLSESTRFLGVFSDKMLKFQVHANVALGKGLKYMLAVKQLQKGKRGVLLRQGTQLYTWVVIPKMLYVAEVWCKPIRVPKEGGKVKQGLIGFANKFTPIQQLAALFTTGGMKSMSTTVLDAHTDYLLIHLLINRTCKRVALQWATVAHPHLMYKLVRRAVKVCQRPSPTPEPAIQPAHKQAAR